MNGGGREARGRSASPREHLRCALGPIVVPSRLIRYENGELRAERHLAVALSLPAKDPAQAQDGEEQCVGVLTREHTLAARYEQNRPPAVAVSLQQWQRPLWSRCPDASSHGTSDIQPSEAQTGLFTGISRHAH